MGQGFWNQGFSTQCHIGFEDKGQFTVSGELILKGNLVVPLFPKFVSISQHERFDSKGCALEEMIFYIKNCFPFNILQDFDLLIGIMICFELVGQMLLINQYVTKGYVGIMIYKLNVNIQGIEFSGLVTNLGIIPNIALGLWCREFQTNQRLAMIRVRCYGIWVM